MTEQELAAAAAEELSLAEFAEEQRLAPALVQHFLHHHHGLAPGQQHGAATTIRASRDAFRAQLGALLNARV